MIILTWLLGAVGVLGVAGAIAAFIFVPAVAVPIVTKTVDWLLGCKRCLVALAFVAVALAAFWGGHHGAYQSGVNDTIAGIARADTKLVDRARAARAKLKECEAEGGNWDQSKGKCR
jgi:hypothetical protein